MDIKNRKKLFITFLRVFAALFVILVVLPFLLEHIMHFIGGGTSPGNDSIRVFKDLVAEKAAVSRFIDAIKKIIILM